MSVEFDARLNMDQRLNFQWKGKTFSQITSSLKRNTYQNNGNIRSMFLANPLKIYRREIASPFNVSCNPRTSLSIDEINRPGGSIVNTASTNPNGLVNTTDDILPNNTCEYPGTCSVFLSPSDNARRRVRSGGMIPRKFDTSRNNDQYYTSSNQYLVSRNRTFKQNQYNFIRQGTSTAKPGDSLSSANVYSPNGINHCQKYFIPPGTTFQYQWIDAQYYTVTISGNPGETTSNFYAVEDVNKILQNTMSNNQHFFISETAQNINKNILFNNNFWYNQNVIFLLSISYNNESNQIELQVLPADSNIFSLSAFEIPNLINTTTPAFTMPTTTVVPGFKILNNVFQLAIGFNAGNYPAIPISYDENSQNVQTNLSSQTFLSSIAPGLQSLYVKLYYKPNNSQFAQQGAVSSSSLIARVKYDTITNSTVPYRNAYGTAVASALAYGVSSNQYTIKDKIGFPMTRTPIISKYDTVTCQTAKPVTHM
jgi:hypothetical protein